jgi:OOP family OmpA-OmpF porin
MKHSVIAILAAACAIPAMAGNGYAGAAVGRAEQTLNVQGVDMSENSSSAKLFAGYQFNPVFGAELGFVHFGTATLSGGGMDVSSTPSSLYAAATGTMRLSDELALYAKLGVARTHTRVSVLMDWSSGSVSADHTGAMFGAGVGYSLNRDVLLFGEYENFDKVLNEGGVCLKLQHIVFGARFKF